MKRLTINIVGEASKALSSGHGSKGTRPKYEVERTGRCLGLINNSEFIFLLMNPKLAKKLVTVGTVDISDVAALTEQEISNKRLLFAIDGDGHEYPTEKLILISPKLEYNSYKLPADDGADIEWGFTCQNAYMQISS